MSTDDDQTTRNMARYLRIAVIRNVLGSGHITREDALDLLNAPLNPGEPDTFVDDRKLLDMTVEEVQKELQIK